MRESVSPLAMLVREMSFDFGWLVVKLFITLRALAPSFSSWLRR